MQYLNNGTVTDLKIAYIGGGSRGRVWTFMTNLAGLERMSGTIRLYDTNREVALRNEKSAII